MVAMAVRTPCTGLNCVQLHVEKGDFPANPQKRRQAPMDDRERGSPLRFRFVLAQGAEPGRIPSSVRLLMPASGLPLRNGTM